MDARRLAAAALVVASMGACRHRHGPPPRPAGVPAEAQWAGGADGGAFVWCRDAPGGAERCTVWDPSGGVWMKGLFRVGGARPASFAAPGTYDGVDGDRIYLANSASMDVVEPPRPPGVPREAAWSGGPMCGVFIACKWPATDGYACTIYDEDDGRVRFRGTYDLMGRDAPSPRSNADFAGACEENGWSITGHEPGLLLVARGEGGAAR